jgi:hypothetical protein
VWGVVCKICFLELLSYCKDIALKNANSLSGAIFSLLSYYLPCYINYLFNFSRSKIEVEGKLWRAGKSVGVVSVDFRKKRTGKLIVQAPHTKCLAVSSKLFEFTSVLR